MPENHEMLSPEISLTVDQRVVVCWKKGESTTGVEEFTVMSEPFDLSLNEQDEVLRVITVRHDTLGVVWLPTECLFQEGSLLRCYNEDDIYCFGGDHRVVGVELFNPEVFLDF